MAVVWLLALALSQQPDAAAEGMKALEEKRYADAVTAFRKAVEQQPENYAAHFHAALAHSLAGNSAEAISGYERTLALKPGLAEAELNLALLLLSGFEAARAQQPPGGNVPAATGDGGPAEILTRTETLLRSAIARKPGSVPATAALGRTLMAQGKLAEAEASLRRAAELDQTNTANLLELAAAYEQRKDAAAAIRLYSAFRDQPGVEERMGNLLLESGKPDEAIAYLEAAITRSPSAANRYALGIAYLRTKQSAKAIASFEQAAAAEPRDANLRLTYGRALRDERKFAPAAQQFYEAVKLKPDSREAWSELAGMLLLLESFPQALAAFEKLESLGEAGAAVHYFKAIAQDRMKLYKPALASYQKFLAMSGNQHPDEEFKARQRVRVIEKELARR